MGSLVAQWIKDRVLPLQWHRFDPWPGNFSLPQVQPNNNNNNKLLFLLCFFKRSLLNIMTKQ